jgi:hypothetical protein
MEICGGKYYIVPYVNNTTSWRTVQYSTYLHILIKHNGDDTPQDQMETSNFRKLLVFLLSSYIQIRPKLTQYEVTEILENFCTFVSS